MLRWVDRQLAVTQVDDPGLKGVLARFDLLDAGPDQLASVLEKTERYCVVLQTMTSPPVVTVAG